MQASRNAWVQGLQRIYRAASLGLGGAFTASVLLVAARIASSPLSLGEVIPPPILASTLIAIAASYLVGAACNAYALYRVFDEWNRLVDKTLGDLEEIAEMLSRAGDPGHSSLELGRLAYYLSGKKFDPLLWSLASLPPVVGLVYLLAASRLMDAASSMRRELYLASTAILRRMDVDLAPAYIEPPPKPLGAMIGALLGYPAGRILSRMSSYVEVYGRSEEEALGALRKALSDRLIEAGGNRGGGEEALRPRAWIITIGNEILSGHTVNTNAAWLGRRLTMLGYLVERGVTCMDDMSHIVEVFRDAFRHKPSIVVSTGGLGPTFDDKTSESLAKALGREWVINEEALRMVEEKYREAGLEMTEHRVKLAKMPRGARPLPNPVGTAPGILVEEDGMLIAALPGVPAEMKGIFEQSLEPLLRERGPGIHYLEKEVTVVGVPESAAAPIIDRAMKISTRIYVKSHPSGIETRGPILTLQIIATGDTAEEAEELIRRVESFLRDELAKLGGSFKEAKDSGEG